MAEDRESPYAALIAAAIMVGVAGAFAVLVATGVLDGGPGSRDTSATPTFAEPVMLSSVDGVLEVTLTAHQGTADFNTVDAPVKNALVYGYEVQRGSSSDGHESSEGVYPAPTLHVSPGEQLIVHYANGLEGLTIADYLDPAFTPVDGEVPIYPPALTSSPINLHTHGLHVSPSGNSDNVLLDIPAGSTNTYTYDLPSDMPQGMYWYHSHRHTLTAMQTYAGLAGLLQVGRADGGIPAVTEHDLPVRTMALQYNAVFGRKEGLAQLNNVNWPQYVSTLVGPTGSQLADGTYEPSLAPVNIADAPVGTPAVTNWYTGDLSINNNRGQYQFIPSNLQSFAGQDPADDLPADSTLPDHQRDVQFTVNGQFEPEVKAKPGQSEIWVLANISDFAYMNVTLTETATGNHPTIAVVGQDGNPYEQVQTPTTNDGTTLLIPPGSRYAIAVTMPEEGDLILEMPELEGNTAPMTSDAVRYTADGTSTPPGVLGTVTIDPSAVSYIDGFFAFPTQQLVRMTPQSGHADPVPFTPGQDLGAYTSFVDTSGETPDVERELVVSGGFDNTFASPQDPKAFVYQFGSDAFPYTPLIQPRVGSMEEWTIVNTNNDQHPIHIHVNDFQVAQVVDPVAGTTFDFLPWGQDNANLPAPAMDSAGNVTAPGILKLRTEFQEFTGTYVIHCHRLNHEDNGLMAIINVIPAVSTYAVAIPGSEPGSKDAVVEVRDGADDSVVASVTPFAGYKGLPSVAMGDVDGDQVLDLIVGAGPGTGPEVVAYSGAGPDPFTTELARFDAFESDLDGGVSVAAAGIDGDAVRDNIIVGSGQGTGAKVTVFSSALPPVGTAPAQFASFSPYEGDGDTAGVTVSAGLVDAMSGRQSIVTAPGPGSIAEVKVFRFDLYTPNGSSVGTHQMPDGTTMTTTMATSDEAGTIRPEPVLAATFRPFGDSYRGGVSLSTGWVAGTVGGAQRIVVGQLEGPGQVKVFASGTALDGEPTMYLQSPSEHGHNVTFSEIGTYAAGLVGVRVATTSTVYGADLLVSGVGSDGRSVVRRIQLAPADAAATTVSPTVVGEMVAASASALALGGA